MRFECTRCGNCCRTRGEHAYVYLTRRDLPALASHLGLTVAETLERHCEEEGGWILLRRQGDACRFLADDGSCGVYEARPEQCRTWPFWVDNLERATWEGVVRPTCPGVERGPLYPAEEIERIARENEAEYEA